MQYLALYTGPNGPISYAFEADDLDAASGLVDAHCSQWYDAAEDELDIDPQSRTMDADIDRALDEGGWICELAANHDGDFALYVQREDRTSIADLLPEISWLAPAGANLDGYDKGAYFAADLEERYTSRTHAIRAALTSYRGPDEHGVELDMVALRDEVYGPPNDEAPRL
jgi:hypothetical protein